MSLPDAVRADVEALAAMERSSAREGERAAAAWGADRLAAAGATAVRTQSFRYSPGWGLAQAVHMVAAATGRLPALAALVSLQLDFSGRAQPLRRVLPAGEGANVVGLGPRARGGHQDRRPGGPPRRRQHRPAVEPAVRGRGRQARRPPADDAA